MVQRPASVVMQMDAVFSGASELSRVFAGAAVNMSVAWLKAASQQTVQATGAALDALTAGSKLLKQQATAAMERYALP